MCARDPAPAGCPACRSEATVRCHAGYPGYVEGTRYDIHHCGRCNTNFIAERESRGEIYDGIYSAEGVAGYDRYRRYADRIGTVRHPLDYLAREEPSCLAVREYLKTKRVETILDVGCGLGYLTWALRQLGYDATGVDVSETAIRQARAAFGDSFRVTDAFAGPVGTDRYDLVLALEVIEHLPDPGRFISDMLDLLRPGGELLLTTPDKEFSPAGAVWQTEPPPVHMTWLSAGSFAAMAREGGFCCRILRLGGGSPRGENLLALYLAGRREVIREPVMQSDGRLRSWKTESVGSVRGLLNAVLHDFRPVRELGSWICRTILGKHPTLAVVAWREGEERH